MWVDLLDVDGMRSLFKDGPSTGLSKSNQKEIVYRSFGRLTALANKALACIEEGSDESHGCMGL